METLYKPKDRRMNPVQGKLLCEIREGNDMDIFILCTLCEWTMISFDDLLGSAMQSWLAHHYVEHCEEE